MANLNIAIKIAAQDNASGPLGRISNSLTGLGNQARSGFAGLQTVGVAALGAVGVGAVAAGAAITSFAVDGVQAAMSMETSLSNIAAVLGHTKEEVAPLGDLIADLGLNPNLKVTAEEAALAINNLATNGLNMTQILDGAAESTVLLANSTGADFGTAANIATDSMAIFNIEAEDMMEAVNGITGVTVASKFGIEDYGLALAQAGGVASAAGVEFDDFNTAITAISPLFASGSDAGTSFKTMLQRLVPGSNAAEDAMRELGIIGIDLNETYQMLADQGFTPASRSMEDVMGAAVDLAGSMGLAEDETNGMLGEMGLLRNQFFDAEGNMQDMATIAGILQDSFAGLSEEQRNEALSTIFGTDAMRAAVGLMEAGEEGFNSLADTMAQTDAMESAATRMDNLAGVMEIIGGVIDTVKLQVGQAFLPVLRMLADNLLVVANDVGPRIVAFFDGLVLILEDGIGFVRGFFSEMQNGNDVLGAIVESLLTWTNFGENMPQGMFDFVINLETGLRNLWAAIQPIIETIVTAVSGFVSWQDVLAALGLVVASVVLPALYSIVTAVAPVIAVGALLIGAISLLRNAWQNDWGGIRTAVMDAWTTTIQPLFAELQQWLSVNIPIALETLRAWWVNTAWPAIQQAVEAVWPVIQLIFQAYVAYITDIFIPAVQILWDLWVNVVWPQIQEAIEIVWPVVKFILEGMWRSLTEDMLPAIQGLYEFWVNTAWPAIKTAVQDAWNAIQPVLDDAKRGIDVFWSAIQEFWNWLNTHIFDFQINLPELPEWAVPGSPLPIHTAWKDFARDMQNVNIAPRMDVGGVAGASGGSVNDNSRSQRVTMINPQFMVQNSQDLFSQLEGLMPV